MTRRQRGARTALAGLACVVTLTITVSGCGPRSETPHDAAPATLLPVPGSSAGGGPTGAANGAPAPAESGYGAVHRVVLTPLALQRLGIRTVPAQRAGTGAGQELVPITAVIYDPNGVPWVYVPVGTRAYQRQAITIQRYEGDTVVLSRGPSAGTPVVVVGTAELLGTEYGVGEE